MALNKLGLYNQALSAVGTRQSVSGLTENSREREVCDTWYETVRDQVLKAADWSSVRKTASLAVLSERDFDVAWASADPDPDWRFMYAAPSDFLYPRYGTQYNRFAVGNRSSQRVIFSDTEDLALTYISRQDNVGLWDVSLQEAVVFGLAARIAQPLTGKNQKARDALAIANDRIMLAREYSANMDSTPMDAMPDWMTVRGISGSTGYSGYTYPYGPLLSFTGGGSQ